MKAKSIKENSSKEINTALRQSMTGDFESMLATTFISEKQHNAAIIHLLSDEGIAIFGATTNDEFIDGETGENSKRK